jgi:hypothetical protein
MKKLTIQAMRRRAKARGGRCLSTVYAHSSSKLTWQCAKGHQWMTTPGHIRQGHWCPVCAGNARSTIRQMQALAESRGGKSLSGVYVNTHTKLLWQCARGHEWEAIPAHIKRGRWCPECHGNHRLTLDEMKGIAVARGGLCLSDEYVNSSTHLLWQCEEGHQWRATPNSVKKGSWCRLCWAQKQARVGGLSLPAMQALAASRGGLCLSDEYVNHDTHLLWQCVKGHRWTTTPRTVKTGRWCPVCWAERRGTVRRLDLPAMRALAASRGGLCLSDEYVNSSTHLLWQCEEGHQWRAIPSSVRSGTWCPACWSERRRRPRHRTLVENEAGGKKSQWTNTKQSSSAAAPLA